MWGLLLANTQQMFYLTTPEAIRIKAARMAGWYILMAVVSVVSSVLQFGGVAQVDGWLAGWVGGSVGRWVHHGPANWPNGPLSRRPTTFTDLWPMNTVG